jgi:hypothetical protein
MAENDRGHAQMLVMAALHDGVPSSVQNRGANDREKYREFQNESPQRNLAPHRAEKTVRRPAEKFWNKGCAKNC